MWRPFEAMDCDFFPEAPAVVPLPTVDGGPASGYKWGRW